MDVIGAVSYCQLNTMMDGLFPRGALNYWKSRLVNDLSDGAINTIIERFEQAASPMSLAIRPR